MGMISTELDKEFCDILNGWHALEKTLPDGATIVDFNLPEWQGGKAFQNREQVLSELDQVIADPESKRDRHFFQRAFGLRAYMQDVLNDRTTPIDDYLTSTMGFKLSYFPDAELAEQKKKVIDLHEAIGIDFNEGPRALAEKSRTIPVDEIPSWFKQRFASAIGTVKMIFDVPPELPEPHVSLFEDNSPTRARINGSGKILHVAFNRTAVKEESEEKLDGTLKHEILGHGVQAALWHDKIAAGLWPINRGLTCMQGFEVFQMEALAEYAPVYFGGNSETENAIHTAAAFGRKVTNNMIFMVQHGLETPENIVKYYQDYVPYRDESFIRDRIHFVQMNSLRRCYLPVYGAGNSLVTHTMNSLDAAGQKDFMRGLYEGYLDPTDIQEMGMRLGVPKMKDFAPARPAEVQAVAQMHP